MEYEDRRYGGNTLYVDMVPKSCWGVSGCKMVKGWRKFSTMVLERSPLCEICSQPSKDAHERWSYDESSGVRKLIRLIALCKMCHAVVHWGRSKHLGMMGACVKHLMEVNQLSYKEAKKLVSKSKKEYKARSKVQWKTDVSMLGVTDLLPPSSKKTKRNRKPRKPGKPGNADVSIPGVGELLTTSPTKTKRNRKPRKSEKTADSQASPSLVLPLDELPEESSPVVVNFSFDDSRASFFDIPGLLVTSSDVEFNLPDCPVLDIKRSKTRRKTSDAKPFSANNFMTDMIGKERKDVYDALDKLTIKQLRELGASGKLKIELISSILDRMFAL